MSPLSRPILFLDVDGVLNSRIMMEMGQWSDRPEDQIDPLAVERLKQIADNTEARIVVSSTWRLWGPNIAALWRVLRRSGMHVIGKTPYLGGERSAGRGDEIQAWLDGWRALERGACPAPFAILDDDCDMGHLLPRLVRTHHETGLLEEHVERATEMLRRRP